MPVGLMCDLFGCQSSLALNLSPDRKGPFGGVYGVLLWPSAVVARESSKLISALLPRGRGPLVSAPARRHLVQVCSPVKATCARSLLPSAVALMLSPDREGPFGRVIGGPPWPPAGFSREAPKLVSALLPRGQEPSVSTPLAPAQGSLVSTPPRCDFVEVRMPVEPSQELLRCPPGIALPSQPERE